MSHDAWLASAYRPTSAISTAHGRQT